MANVERILDKATAWMQRARRKQMAATALRDRGHAMVAAQLEMDSERCAERGMRYSALACEHLERQRRVAA